MTTTTHAARASAVGHPAYTETMPCRPENARRARVLVSLALSAWDLDGPQRRRETHRLRARRQRGGTHRMPQHPHHRHPPAEDRVRIAVTDKSTKKPAPRTAGANNEHGRGLAVVAALAETTGTDTFTWGKRVWAELRTPGADQWTVCPAETRGPAGIATEWNAKNRGGSGPRGLGSIPGPPGGRGTRRTPSRCTGRKSR